MGAVASLFLKSTSIFGSVSNVVDNITPPLGVALPVKFVFPAEIVSKILQV